MSIPGAIQLPQLFFGPPSQSIQIAFIQAGLDLAGAELGKQDSVVIDKFGFELGDHTFYFIHRIGLSLAQLPELKNLDLLQLALEPVFIFGIVGLFELLFKVVDLLFGNGGWMP